MPKFLDAEDLQGKKHHINADFIVDIEDCGDFCFVTTVDKKTTNKFKVFLNYQEIVKKD